MATPPIELYLKKLTSIESLDKFTSFIKTHYTNNQINLYINTIFKTNHINASNKVFDEIEKSDEFIKLKDNLLNKSFFYLTNILLKINNNSFSINYKFDKIYDVITIQCPNDRFEADFINIEKTVNQLSMFFNFIQKETIEYESLSEIQKENISLYENNLIDLKRTTEKLIAGIGDQASKWNEYVVEKEKELSSKYEEKEKKLTDAIENDKSKLGKEKEEFDKKKKEFDERENKIVRRALLTSIKDVIEKQKIANFSGDTQRKRKSVNSLCILGMIISGLLLIAQYLFINIGKMDSMNSYFILAAFSALFVSNFIYFIRWNYLWFKEHADLELINLKFSTDILRASWVAELTMEWQKEIKSGIPNELLTRFTTNLFLNNKSNKDLSHPYEDLIKLIQKISKVKIGKTGIVVESKENNTNDSE